MNITVTRPMTPAEYEKLEAAVKTHNLPATVRRNKSNKRSYNSVDIRPNRNAAQASPAIWSVEQVEKIIKVAQDHGLHIDYAENPLVHQQGLGYLMKIES